jgi:hypothetical protein
LAAAVVVSPLAKKVAIFRRRCGRSCIQVEKSMRAMAVSDFHIHWTLGTLDYRYGNPDSANLEARRPG